MKFKIGDRVIVNGKQVFNTEDQTGTIINVFLTTVKVQLDNGSKWFVTTDYVTPYTDSL